MKYPAYQKYKDSGVSWLGEVPVDWDVSPIKYLVSIPVADGPHETPEIFNEGIPFVSAEAIHNGRINFDKIRGYISEEDHRRYSKKYKPQKGDIYMVKSGATTGRVAMVETDLEFNIWSALAAIRCNSHLANKNFIYHYLHSKEFQTAVQLSWSFGTQQNIGMGVIQNLAVPLPSLHEQTAIADFLDQATGKIDTLVEKKRALIGLLKEKRTALISRSVTRGLPSEVAREFGLEPHTCFKASGIEWLGEVSEGWEVKRVKHIGQIRYGLGEPPEYDPEGIPFIRATDIYRGKIDLGAVKRVSPDDVPWNRRPKLELDEILVVRSGAYTGDSAIVTSEVAGCLAGYDMVLTITKAVPYFIAWVLLSKYMLESQIQIARLRAAQPHLNAEELGDFIILIPSQTEQSAIATYLDRETTKIDKLIEKVETVIERLQEYRTSLITATVTGKIDVREAAA